MGARVYLPILGRFLQVDPVEGGTDNSYVYANDPVNEFDLDGRAIPIVIAGALYVGGVAWSAYDLYKKPSWGNAGWLVASFIPGGALAKGPRWFKRTLTAVTSLRFTSKTIHKCSGGRGIYGCINKIQRRVNRFNTNRIYNKGRNQRQRNHRYKHNRVRPASRYRYYR